MHRYATLAELTGAVSAGDDEALLVDSAACANAVQDSAGRLRTVGDAYDLASVGIAVNSADHEFADAFQAALARLFANGTYTRILRHWGVSDGAVDRPLVRP